MRATVAFEETRQQRTAIVVTELPYQVNKASLAEKIAELVQQKKIDGIADIRDESDRDGMRLVIECKRDAAPRRCSTTSTSTRALQLAFSMNMLALVDGQPQMLPLKGVLQHSSTTAARSSAGARVRPGQGARAGAHPRRPQDRARQPRRGHPRPSAKARTSTRRASNLMTRFELSERQANAILDMQLRRLAALERKKIEDEYLATIKLDRRARGHPGQPGARPARSSRTSCASCRRSTPATARTRVEGDADRELTDEDLIAEEDVVDHGLDARLHQAPAAWRRTAPGAAAARA